MELTSGFSDRDVVHVLDQNIFSGVMGAKTSTEKIQERIVGQVFASIDDSYENLAQK